MLSRSSAGGWGGDASLLTCSRCVTLSCFAHGRDYVPLPLFRPSCVFLSFSLLALFLLLFSLGEQTVVVCGSCSTILCQPTGGKARLTEGCSFRKKVD